MTLILVVGVLKRLVLYIIRQKMIIKTVLNFKLNLFCVPIFCQLVVQIDSFFFIFRENKNKYNRSKIRNKKLEKI